MTPELELWGFSKNLHLLSEVAYVAIQTGHPKACVLTDVFHLYKGGSDFRSIRLLSAQAIQLVHLNDFPAEPPRQKIDDSYRVFPGDGVAPLTQFLQDLRSTGNGKVLSLELFNRKLWERDALDVAKELSGEDEGGCERRWGERVKKFCSQDRNLRPPPFPLPEGEGIALGVNLVRLQRARG